MDIREHITNQAPLFLIENTKPSESEGSEADIDEVSKEILTNSKKTSKTIKLPNVKNAFKSIDPKKFADLSQISTFTEAKEKIDRARVPSKAEVAYKIIETRSKKLKNLHQNVSKLADPREREIAFREGMIKLGYAPVSVNVICEDNKTKVETAWSLPTEKFIVHTCPFHLTTEKILDKLNSEQGRADPDFILNNNAKLCVSTVQMGSGQIFQPEKRVGLLFHMPTDSILDTYSEDRLSPVGFLKPKEAIQSMSPQELTKYQEDIERVNHFIAFLKRHRVMVDYVTSVSISTLNTLLAELKTDMKKYGTDIEKIAKLITGLESEQKKHLTEPKASEHEKTPALIKHLDLTIDVAENYQSILKDLKLSSNLFEGQEEGDILEDLKEMRIQVANFYANSDSWSKINIHPEASKWEKEIRENKQLFVNRLMPGKLHGPDALETFRRKGEGTFTELNALTSGSSIIGFGIDALHFNQTNSGLELDLKEAKQKVEEEVKMLQIKIETLETQKKNANPKDLVNIETAIKETKKQINKYAKYIGRSDLANILEYSTLNHFPVLLIGQERNI